MPARLDPGDRKILIFAGVVLAVLMLALVVVAPPATQKELGYPSSYSSASGGAKAAYLLLKELGYSVERWEHPPDRLPEEPKGTLLVLANPVFPSSAEERSALHRYVRRGGRVLATGLAGTPVPKSEVAAELAGALIPENEATADYDANPLEWQEYRALLPSPLSQNASKIVMSPGAYWDKNSDTHLGVFGTERRPVVVTYRFGEGQVIWWAASTPLTNAGIIEADNLMLFLNSAGAPQETRILWDEYYHGQRGTLSSYFARTPVLWGLAQLGLVALAVLFTFARRHGPVRPPVAESRLSPLEFVSTLGGLYHRAHAARAAVEIAFHRFRYLLGRRLGMSPNAPLAQLYQGARERLGWREPGLIETLQHCESAKRDSELSDQTALTLVQALEQYERVLRLKKFSEAGSSKATRT